jgi:hypothetical protein
MDRFKVFLPLTKQFVSNADKFGLSGMFFHLLFLEQILELILQRDFDLVFRF